MCPQQYFISYILGIPERTNKKAEKGTMTHKVLETLANMKHCIQDGRESFNDDALGKIDVNQRKMMDPEFVHTLCDAAFYHYKNKSPNDFGRMDQNDIHEWVFSTLQSFDGAYDPRFRNIVRAEKHFDFAIDEDWAHYDYEDPVTGQKISGQLRMKGTIDLTTQWSDKVYEIIDWKTGKRIDWGTGEEKDFHKLSHDPQLSIYHYALHKLYPDIDTFVMTIHYINDGGPFTLCYERRDIPKTLEMLRGRMTEIQETKRPRLKSVSGRHFFCNKICHYGKNKCENNPEKTICRNIRDETLKLGIDEVTRKYTHKDFNVSFYSNPGE